MIFDELAAEPTCDRAQDAVDAFKKSGAEFIVAVGGGSVMDTAKLASVLATDDYSVGDLLDHPYMAKKCVKTLMIPTTAGTGAEATPNAIVAVPEKELKVGIVNDAMIADGVILDARMIKSLPGSIAAATGVDALCHAIECFTSKKRNPFSDTFALQAFEMIVKNIEKACDDPGAMEEKAICFWRRSMQELLSRLREPQLFTHYLIHWEENIILLTVCPMRFYWRRL